MKVTRVPVQRGNSHSFGVFCRTVPIRYVCTELNQTQFRPTSSLEISYDRNHEINVQVLVTSYTTYSYAQSGKKQKRGTRRIRSALSSIFRKQLKEETTRKSQVDIFPETSKTRRYFRTFRMKSKKRISVFK